jgi:hypothetical protein
VVASAHIAHESAGRLRVRVPARRGNEGFFQQAVDALASMPGVSHVQANPVTASILVLHEREVANVAEFAEQQRLFRLDPEPSSGLPAAVRVSAALRRIDHTLFGARGGQAELRTVAFLALLALATHQTVKGNVMAPAVTLLWYALTLLPAFGGTTDAAPAGSQEP